MPDEVKKYRVVIQDRAAEMLVHHARFLAQVSEAAANRLAEEFVKETKGLEIIPEHCPWLFDPYIPDHKYRRLIFQKQYMLLFQVIDTVVYVDAMMDCRQDYSWLL